MITVKGKVTDALTRCVHYHTEVDVMAIKFKCCGDFYPCSECHQETTTHPAEVWPKELWDEKAILCGRCQHLLTINEYLASGDKCPSCRGDFNPKCSNHYHLYFQQK